MFVQCLEMCSQTKLHQVEESLRTQDTPMEFSKGRFDVQLWKVELKSVDGYWLQQIQRIGCL